MELLIPLAGVGTAIVALVCWLCKPRPVTRTELEAAMAPLRPEEIAP